MEGLLISSVDAALAGQNALLAAESLGYGGVIIGLVRYKSEEVAELFNLPDYTYPVSVSYTHLDVYKRQVKYSYEYEFFNNTRTCSHIEIIIKSCKWIDIEVRTGIEEDFYKSNDDLDTDISYNG